MTHISKEPQAQFRVTRKPSVILGAGDNGWFCEQRHMHDPIAFFDVFIRGESFDQYFYYVLLLLVFGLFLL
jgi:hypothetical protein